MVNLLIVGDPHFGVESNSGMWLDIYINYFNSIMPIIDKSDYVVITGDLYDGKQSISTIVMSEVIDLVYRMSKNTKIYILVGNHDTPLKNNNEVNVAKSLKYIPNVEVVHDDAVVDTGFGKIKLCSWRNNIDELNKVIENDDSDYFIGHNTINEMTYSHEPGIDIGILSKYTKVWMGHVHSRQELMNCEYVGVPYHTRRVEANNVCGVTQVQFVEGGFKQKFLENTLSPRYVSMSIHDIMHMSLDDANNACRNNIVEINIDRSDVTDSFDFEMIRKSVDGWRSMSPIYYNSAYTNDGVDMSDVDFSISDHETMAKKYIDTCTSVTYRSNVYHIHDDDRSDLIFEFTNLLKQVNG